MAAQGMYPGSFTNVTILYSRISNFSHVDKP